MFQIIPQAQRTFRIAISFFSIKHCNMCHKYISLSHRNPLQRVYVSGLLSDDGNGPFFFFCNYLDGCHTRSFPILKWSGVCL